MRLLQIEKEKVDRQRDFYKVIKLITKDNLNLLNLVYSQGYENFEIIRDYCINTDEMRTNLLEAMHTNIYHRALSKM